MDTIQSDTPNIHSMADFAEFWWTARNKSKFCFFTPLSEDIGKKLQQRLKSLFIESADYNCQINGVDDFYKWTITRREPVSADPELTP